MFIEFDLPTEHHPELYFLDGDVALLKWMVGFTLAMLVTLLFRSFTH